MLVSVTERTREIGVRVAVGARSRDVRRQFLTEAVFVSAAGGLVGIAFGYLISIGLTQFLEWPTDISTVTALGSFGFAAGIGIFFGWYPARRAAEIDPIDALRFE
jgi:putative ABC transport system permease protein